MLVYLMLNFYQTYTNYESSKITLTKGKICRRSSRFHVNLSQRLAWAADFPARTQLQLLVLHPDDYLLAALWHFILLQNCVKRTGRNN